VDDAAGAGDLDGDGHEDLLVSTSFAEAVYVFAGPGR
jgi:hypothetical protein